MATEPQDHKAPVEPFTWTAPDGRTVTLKPFSKLPIGVFRKAGQMNDMASTFALLEAATDEDGLTVLDDVEIGALDQVFEAWTAASGVESPGESSGSST